MAIYFDAADGDGADYLENTSPTVTAVPLTFACWAKPDDIDDQDGCITLGKTGSATYHIALNLRANGRVEAGVRDSGGLSTSQSDPYEAKTWQHVAAVFASTTNRLSYLDGVAGTVNTVSRTPTGIDELRIGQYAGTWYRPFDGAIAECAIWNVALSAGEVGALASGLSPLLIQLPSLVSYYPLMGDYQDRFGANPVTPNNTVVWSADHPPVMKGTPQQHRPAWGKI